MRLQDTDLNYTILSSILQVIFLKTGQESGFAEPGTLALLADTDGINRRLARACKDAGLNPNILFEKGPEGFQTIPLVPDDALRQVIRSMDSEKFPVPVSTLPLEHLAGVFEHFLGTRMQVAEGYRVKRTGKSAGALYRKREYPGTAGRRVCSARDHRRYVQGTGSRATERESGSLIPHVEPGSFCSLLTGSSPGARPDIRIVRNVRES